MTNILPIASGKGGVGKSVVAANLGVALALRGKTVILVDLDLGASNLHTFLGVKNTHAGLGSYIQKQERNIEALIVDTDIPRLYLVPGDVLIPGTANLPYFTKQRIIKQLNELIADFVLLDLGSGTAFNTVDFFLSSTAGVVVTSPETTAILNAYSFLKTALFRLLYRSFPAKSPERETIQAFMGERIEGSAIGFSSLVDSLMAIDPESGRLARDRLAGFLPRVVLNMGRSTHDFTLGGKLRQIAGKNLEIGIEYIGYIRSDRSVHLSILKRQPAILLEPNSVFTSDIYGLADRLISRPVPEAPFLHDGDEDIQSLQAEMAGGE